MNGMDMQQHEQGWCLTNGACKEEIVVVCRILKFTI